LSESGYSGFKDLQDRDREGPYRFDGRKGQSLDGQGAPPLQVSQSIFNYQLRLIIIDIFEGDTNNGSI
jgi:hypothetical protein